MEEPTLNYYTWLVAEGKKYLLRAYWPAKHCQVLNPFYEKHCLTKMGRQKVRYMDPGRPGNRICVHNVNEKVSDWVSVEGEVM